MRMLAWPDALHFQLHAHSLICPLPCMALNIQTLAHKSRTCCKFRETLAH